jgi:hypothetical protein
MIERVIFTPEADDDAEAFSAIPRSAHGIITARTFLRAYPQAVDGGV